MSVLKMGTDVWPAIADVLDRPGPRCVAVPYIGINAAELLIDLGPGDLLVCNASNSSLSGTALTLESAIVLADAMVADNIKKGWEEHA